MQTLIRTLSDSLHKRKAEQQDRRQKEAVLLAAIDQVVEGIDPRIRLVSRYQQKLRQAVKHSLRYIDKLVATIPEPLEVNSKTWATDPYVNAFFATADSMQTIFSHSTELRQFFEQRTLTECYAGLAMTIQEKKVLGMQLSGEVIQREVPQTTVSFVDHRVGLPAATEAQTREGLKRLALNFLVSQVLERILSLRTQRDTLEKQKQILLIKLKYLQSKQRGLESLSGESEEIESQLNSLQQKLAENQESLQDVRVQLDELDDYVNHLNAVLAHPEDHLSVHKVSMRLNRLGVKLNGASAEQGNEITLAEVRGGNHLKRVIVFVKCPREELLSQEAMDARVSRYLTTI